MTCVFGGIFIFLLLAPDDPDLRPTWAVQKYIHVGLSTRASVHDPWQPLIDRYKLCGVCQYNSVQSTYMYISNYHNKYHIRNLIKTKFSL